MGQKIKVAKLADLPKGKMIEVDVGGTSVLLANIDGQVCAIDNVCSHAGGSLHEGCLDGETVTCPLHDAQFSVKTGKISDDTPWAQDQACFRVIVEDGEISVEIP